ncbi:MAG: hypothetical protein ACIALR_11785 [Blastopirellula sp. JB062]
MLNSELRTLQTYVAECAARNLIQWWFESRGTPARESLNKALFDRRTHGLKSLSSPAVRRAVWQCALRHKALHTMIARSAGVAASDEPLRQGDRIRLRVSLPILDGAGRIIRVHRGGETWRVVGRDGERSVWLEQPDGRRQIWENDREILSQFERLAS